MKKVLLSITALFLFFLSGCKMTKYTSDKFPDHQLIFGKGGGFAGVETSFILLENGQIFRQVGTEGSYEELKPIRKKEAKAFFSKLSSLQLYKLDIEKPGNLYYFLQEITSSLDSRVTWGSGDYLPPQALMSLYKELHTLANNRESAADKTPVEQKKEEQKSDEKRKNDGKEVIQW